MSLFFNKNQIITRIEDKWYDLTDFYKEHPGGYLPLALVNGRDGTGLFKLHHPFTSKNLLENYLKKYECRTDPEILEKKYNMQKECEYDYFESDFEIELKKEVKEHLIKYFQIDYNKKINGIQLLNYKCKASNIRLIQLALLGIITLINLIFYLKGYFFSLITFPFFLWIYGVGFWHDASHFALFINNYLNLLTMYSLPIVSSPSSWFHEHIIGHHVYTNIETKDPDLYHNPKYLRLSRLINWKITHKNQLYNLPLIWSFGITLGINLFADFFSIIKNRYHRVVPLIDINNINIYTHLFGRFIYILILFYPFYHFGLIKGIFFSLIPQIIFSLLFMFSTQINHLMKNNFQQRKNIYEHQVLTSNDISTNNIFLFFLTGGLNLQIEHHLFPSINSWHLLQIKDVVKKVCLKYNLEYKEYPNIWSALKEHFAYVKYMSLKQD